jgi:hypothetical protein
MLAKQILAKTMEMKLEDVAKEVKIPYRKLTAALRKIECEPSGKGKKGWVFKGNDELVLEQSIYDFVDLSSSKTKRTNNSLNNSNSVNNVNSQSDSRKDDPMVSEIQALIKGKKKNEDARVYKGIYFDKDIAEFLDNVQHGNKSEIVNKILRQYLQDNELM